MNPAQIARQLKHKLETVTWVYNGSVTQAVFGTAQGRVRIMSSEPSTKDDVPVVFPWAIIIMGSGNIDPDDVDLVTQDFRIVCAAQTYGDQFGEAAVAGGRVYGAGTSPNRGALEILERVHHAVSSMDGDTGVQIQVSASSVGGTKEVGNNRHLTLAELGVSAVCTMQVSHIAPQRLAHVGGAWTWAGDQCVAVGDFFQFRLVWKAGSSPSAGPWDGTVVYTGTAQTSGTLAATAGRTYTVFADYSHEPASSPHAGAMDTGSSSPVLGSYKVT